MLLELSLCNCQKWNDTYFNSRSLPVSFWLSRLDPSFLIYSNFHLQVGLSIFLNNPNYPLLLLHCLLVLSIYSSAGLFFSLVMFDLVDFTFLEYLFYFPSQPICLYLRVFLKAVSDIRLMTFKNKIHMMVAIKLRPFFSTVFSSLILVHSSVFWAIQVYHCLPSRLIDSSSAYTKITLQISRSSVMMSIHLICLWAARKLLCLPWKFGVWDILDQWVPSILLYTLLSNLSRALESYLVVMFQTHTVVPTQWRCCTHGCLSCRSWFNVSTATFAGTAQLPLIFCVSSWFRVASLRDCKV